MSNWNFKLSEPTGLTLTSAYTTNSDVPDSSTAVATKKASTDPTGYIDSFKASYFAYISSTQPADTYSGKVKYTVFHNAELIYNYTIRYSLDSGTGGPDPNPQTGKSNTGSVQLSGTEPTKEGFEFVGWCSVQPANNNTDNPTCGGQTYTAGQDYTLSEIDIDTTLHAIWKQNKPTYGQDCNVNGKVMKDNKCWSKSNIYSSEDNWSVVQAACQYPWRLPSLSDFNELLLAYYPSASVSGEGYTYKFNNDISVFTDDWDPSGNGWGSWYSSSIDSSNYAYYLYLYQSGISSSAHGRVGDEFGNVFNYSDVRCVSDL